MNYSRQCEIILDTLKRNTIHPTAEKLHSIIKEEQPDSNIGIATVYRNLNKMANLGEIKRIIGLESSEHFDHNTYTHYHFICDKCHRIFDISCDVAPDIIENTKRKTGFNINNYDITFHGICNECKNELD